MRIVDFCIENDLVDILEELIEEKGLSFMAMSKERRIPAIAFGYYLRGVIPTTRRAVRLADYFECSLDYLFAFSDVIYFEHRGYDLSKFIPRCKQLLQMNKITMVDCTRKLGLNDFCFQHWQSGVNYPSMETLMKLSQTLSCSIDYLVGRSDLM